MNILQKIIAKRGLKPCWTPETGWIDQPEAEYLAVSRTGDCLASFAGLSEAISWAKRWAACAGIICPSGVLVNVN